MSRPRSRVPRPGPVTVVRWGVRSTWQPSFFEHLGEPGVALPAGGTQAFDGDRAARHRGGGQEVACVRGVRLDRVVARPVAAGGLDDEPGRRLLIVRQDRHAERLHDVGRQRQVRLRDHRARDLDEQVAPRVRRRQQQAADELAGRRGNELDVPATQSLALHDHRRIPPPPFVVDAHAQRPQHVRQGADRSFAHPLDPVQPIPPRADRAKGDAEPHGRAAVAAMQVSRGRGQVAGAPGHLDSPGRLVERPAHAQRAQRRQHALGVVGQQDVVEHAGPRSQGSHGQCPVGEALRAGNGDDRLERPVQRCAGVVGHGAGTISPRRGRARGRAGPRPATPPPGLREWRSAPARPGRGCRAWSSGSCCAGPPS